MPTFRTSFSTPAALTSVTAVPDTDRSAILVTWSAPAIAGAEFWAAVVMRRVVGESTWTEVGSVTDVAVLEFADVEAPHGIELEYSVRVDNGWAQGPDTRSAPVTLELKYWIIAPGDASLVFELRFVNAYTAREEHQQESFAALGRRAPLIVSGELLAPAGSLGSLILREDRGIIDLVRRAIRVDPYVLLKDPFGSVLRVKLGTMDRTPQPGGAIAMTLAYAAAS